MQHSIAAASPLNGAAIRGRGIGMLVGAGFGAWWANTALDAEPVVRNSLTEAAIALVTIVLLAAGIATFWRGTRTASPDAGPRQRGRHVWGKFLVVLVAEIAAINLVAWALTHYHLMSCLLPAIAIIVGLHFYPLARVFRAPYMHITATLMTVAGVGAVIAIASGAAASTPIAVAAAVCAFALWMTAAFGWMQVRNRLATLHTGTGTTRVDGTC